MACKSKPNKVFEAKIQPKVLRNELVLYLQMR